MTAVKQAIKRRALPTPGPRRLPFGVARRIRMQIDFEVQTRTYLGLYEVELNRHLRRMLTPGVSAFDIGAQHGYSALLIAKHTGSRVAAFDCNRACLLGMRASFGLNPDLGMLVTPVEALVGDGPGELGLDECAYSDGFVRISEDRHRGRGVGRIALSPPSAGRARAGPRIRDPLRSPRAGLRTAARRAWLPPDDREPAARVARPSSDGGGQSMARGPRALSVRPGLGESRSHTCAMRLPGDDRDQGKPTRPPSCALASGGTRCCVIVQQSLRTAASAITSPTTSQSAGNGEGWLVMQGGPPNPAVHRVGANASD